MDLVLKVKYLVLAVKQGDYALAGTLLMEIGMIIFQALSAKPQALMSASPAMKSQYVSYDLMTMDELAVQLDDAVKNQATSQTPFIELIRPIIAVLVKRLLGF